MRSSFLTFSPPLIGEDEIDEVLATLRSDWITTGPRVRRFEEDFARFVGAPGALALSSCTAAMHVALATLGIGHGDQVITSPMTFCSSVHVIEQVGAQPVLVDVEPDTLNIDPESVARAIDSHAPGADRIRAILPVHLYGHPCDLDPLYELAARHNLYVVEDAAHALPATYRTRAIGRQPRDTSPQPSRDLVAFSFYATKNMTTAEGGMLIGPSDALEDARVWSLHGMSRDAFKRYGSEGSWHYEVVVPGFKYNMTDIQAALGIHQLRRLPELQRRRRQIVGRYNLAFKSVEQVEIPTERPGIEHAWHIYALRLNLELLKIGRGDFIDELKRLNIGASVHFIPIHLHPYYHRKYGYRPTDFPVAYREYQRLVSLPLFPRMTDADVDDVIEAVLAIAKRYRA